MYLIVAAIALLLAFWYLESFTVKYVPAAVPVRREHFVSEDKPTNWNEMIQKIDLDPSIVKSQQKYANNITQYSSGANFTSVADDNTSPMYTNFIGFSRPHHVEIDPTARQVPDIDEDVFKRNKHMYFR